MNKREVNFFKKRLTSELKDLLSGENCNFEGLRNSEDVLPDLVDRASSLIDRSLSQNICDRKNDKIRKIERALDNLANGNFGVCRRCGDDIAIKRLKANPVARHCITCKTEIETRERLTAD